MNWIKTTENLPDSGESVLVYWYEEEYDLHQTHVCTYYREGDIVTDEVTPTGKTPEERLYDALYGGRGDKVIEQAGFYMYDCVDNTGLCKWRKHSDCITHWARIVPPEREK